MIKIKRKYVLYKQNKSDKHYPLLQSYFSDGVFTACVLIQGAKAYKILCSELTIFEKHVLSKFILFFYKHFIQNKNA